MTLIYVFIWFLLLIQALIQGDAFLFLFCFHNFSFFGRSRCFSHRISFNLWFSLIRDHLKNVSRFCYGSGILSSPMYPKGRHTVPVYSIVGKVKTDPSAYVYHSISPLKRELRSSFLRSIQTTFVLMIDIFLGSLALSNISQT